MFSLLSGGCIGVSLKCTWEFLDGDKCLLRQMVWEGPAGLQSIIGRSWTGAQCYLRQCGAELLLRLSRKACCRSGPQRGYWLLPRMLENCGVRRLKVHPWIYPWIAGKTLTSPCLPLGIPNLWNEGGAWRKWSLRPFLFLTVYESIYNNLYSSE